MSEGDNSDDDISKILQDLEDIKMQSRGEETRKVEKKVVEDEKWDSDEGKQPEKGNTRSANSELGKNPGNKEDRPPERENSAKSGQRQQINPTRSRIMAPENPSTSKINRTFPSSLQNEPKGNSLLTSLFSGEDPNKTNRPAPAVVDSKTSTNAKAPTDKGKLIQTNPLPTKNDASDWLGLGNPDEEDDLMKSLRLGTSSSGGPGPGPSQTRRKAEKPLRSTAGAGDTDTDNFMAKLYGAKKIPPVPSTPPDQFGSFEDKLTKGLSSFEDMFGASNTKPPSPPVRAPTNPVVRNPNPSALANPPNDMEKNSFLQSLFGTAKSEISSNPLPVTEESVVPDPEDHQLGSAAPVRKKVVKRPGIASIPSASNSAEKKSFATLQVASHLIDEDELKAMSSSLKTLYTNQLDLLEKSYSEQMACQTQCHVRKEDMLREEIRLIHNEYETRVERLKSQLQEAENKRQGVKIQEQSNISSEISALADQMKSLQKKMDLISVQHNASPELIQEQLLKGVNQAIQSQFHKIENFLMGILEEKLEKRPGNGNGLAALEVLRPEMHRELDKLERKRRKDIVKFGNSVVDETAKSLGSVVLKLSEVQKKVGESMGKKILTAISQQPTQKDKSFAQIKEFREDLHRFSSKLENKNAMIRKSQTELESEQKQMSQHIQDLNHWLQVQFTRNLINAQSNPNSVNGGSLIQSQTDKEIQLLKEERKSLSESMAQINVEKRKLMEEKIAAEQERREIQKERSRINDLEISLKNKLADAEELHKEVETARQENFRLGGEILRQQNEVEKDRIRQKESLRSIEDNIRLQQENILREKMEILREKEFFEKLRSQLLCPGCLKATVSLPGMIGSSGDHLHPYNFDPMHLGHGQRTLGDGLEKPLPIFSSFRQPLLYPLFPTATPVHIDDEKLNEEIRQLDDLYLGPRVR